MTGPNLKIALPPPIPEYQKGISGLTDNELCYIIGVIISRPGIGFTEDELDELAAINAEFQRRALCKRTAN